MPGNHFLVFWNEDDHFGIYGVFNSTNEVFEALNKESEETKVRLIYMGRIHEMKGTEVIDEIYLLDVKEFIEIGLEGLSIAQENGLEEV